MKWKSIRNDKKTLENASLLISTRLMQKKYFSKKQKANSSTNQKLLKPKCNYFKVGRYLVCITQNIRSYSFSQWKYMVCSSNKYEFYRYKYNETNNTYMKQCKQLLISAHKNVAYNLLQANSFYKKKQLFQTSYTHII